MDSYQCRKGTTVSDHEAEDYDDLLSQETEYIDDDGLEATTECAACQAQFWAGPDETSHYRYLADPQPDQHICMNPPCPDCGVGMLLWAEAGYVPWHRVCNRCGSHWELYPGGHDGNVIKKSRVRRARFYRR